VTRAAKQHPIYLYLFPPQCIPLTRAIRDGTRVRCGRRFVACCLSCLTRMWRAVGLPCLFFGISKTCYLFACATARIWWQTGRQGEQTWFGIAGAAVACSCALASILDLEPRHCRSAPPVMTYIVCYGGMPFKLEHAAPGAGASGFSLVYRQVDANLRRTSRRGGGFIKKTMHAFRLATLPALRPARALRRLATSCARQLLLWRLLVTSALICHRHSAGWRAPTMYSSDAVTGRTGKDDMKPAPSLVSRLRPHQPGAKGLTKNMTAAVSSACRGGRPAVLAL
jgi:hypothetical protein